MTSLRDVARHAGVSTMTVSNVVNNKPGVSASTRVLVEASIRHLGYKPNLSARNLARGRTGMLTLAIPEVEIPYFAEVSSAMMRAAQPLTYGILIDQTEWNRDRELDIVHGSRDHLTDGILLYPSTLNQSDLDRSDPGVPMVLFGGSEVFSNSDHVVIDNIGAAEDATRHLIDLGHRRIAVLGPHLEPKSHKPNGRLVGHAKALRRAGLAYDTQLVINAPTYHRVDGYRSMEHLLNLPEPPTAVFCLSDLLAVGALHAAQDRGIRVPEDLSLVGFDDIEEVSFSNPALTSIRPDKAAIAQSALELLHDRINGIADQPRRTIIAGHKLILRNSTTAPRD